MKSLWKLGLALLALSTVAVAQPFSRQPTLDLASFTCDDEDSLVTDRINKCLVSFLYVADPDIGLDSIKIEFLSYYIDENSMAKTEIRPPMTYSKVNGMIVPPEPFRRFRERGRVLTEYYLYVPFRVQVDSAGRTYQQAKVKLTFRFANGIEYRKEATIRVR